MMLLPSSRSCFFLAVGGALTPTPNRLACKAFSDVFRRHQSGHGLLLDWLALNLERAWPKSAKEASLLQKVM